MVFEEGVCERQTDPAREGRRPTTSKGLHGRVIRDKNLAYDDRSVRVCERDRPSQLPGKEEDQPPARGFCLFTVRVIRDKNLAYDDSEGVCRVRGRPREGLHSRRDVSLSLT